MENGNKPANKQLRPTVPPKPVIVDKNNQTIDDQFKTGQKNSPSSPIQFNKFTNANRGNQSINIWPNSTSTSNNTDNSVNLNSNNIKPKLPPKPLIFPPSPRQKQTDLSINKSSSSSGCFNNNKSNQNIHKSSSGTSFFQQKSIFNQNNTQTTSAVSTENKNKFNPFAALQKKIVEAQRKSVSLGRNIAPPTSLSLALSSSPSTSDVGKKVSFTTDGLNKENFNNISPPEQVLFRSHPFQRAISFSLPSDSVSPLFPPVPPPRNRKRLSLSNPISPTSPINPIVTNDLYAQIDKELKWELRKIKQQNKAEGDENENKLIADDEDNKEKILKQTKQRSKSEEIFFDRLQNTDKLKSDTFNTKTNTSHLDRSNSTATANRNKEKGNAYFCGERTALKKFVNSTDLSQVFSEFELLECNKRSTNELIQSESDKLLGADDNNDDVFDKLHLPINNNNGAIEIETSAKDTLTILNEDTNSIDELSLEELDNNNKKELKKQSSASDPTYEEIDFLEEEEEKEKENADKSTHLNKTNEKALINNNNVNTDSNDNDNKIRLASLEKIEEELCFCENIIENMEVNLHEMESQAKESITPDECNNKNNLQKLQSFTETNLDLIEGESVGNSKKINETDASSLKLIGDSPAEENNVPLITGKLNISLIGKNEENNSNSNIINLKQNSKINSGEESKNSNNRKEQEDPVKLRRRSWSHSDFSISPSESFSSIGSSRIDNYILDKRSTMSSSYRSWIDEDELSNGALGDAENENSDAHYPEENQRQQQATSEGISRRRRINKFFSSFGKGNKNSPGRNKGRGNNVIMEIVRPCTSVSAKKSSSYGITSLSAAIFNLASPPVQQISSAKSPSSLSASSHNSQDTAISHNNDNTSQGYQRQGSVPKSPVPPAYNDEILADLSPKQRQAYYVASEIYTSENRFVDVLNLLTVDFPKFIEEMNISYKQKIVPDSDLNYILKDLTSLKEVNLVLQSDLEERIGQWKDNPKVADIIVKKGPFLKHYSGYIKDFEKIVSRFDELLVKYPYFKSAVDRFESRDLCQKLNIKHFLLKPVQRMPQYRLLLEDYLKNLEFENNDYEDTVKAISIVRQVAEHANKAIQLQVNAEKLVQLQNRLCINIIRPDSHLLKVGELLKCSRKVLQPRYFALMTDTLLCMMYTSSGGGADLKLSYELPLAGMRISQSQNEEYKTEFSVYSVKRSFNLVAKSTKERDEWMKAIKDAIFENIRKKSCYNFEIEREFMLGKEAPIWIQDSRVTMCQVCIAEFTLTFRRHHCRSCGKVVCSNCSSNEAPLKYKNYEAARVCHECFQYLLDEFNREETEKPSKVGTALRARFKKFYPSLSKKRNRYKKYTPQRLEIQSMSGECQQNGYLLLRERRIWRKYWYVLYDRVLFECAACEDVVASRSIPILGYQIECFEENFEGVDKNLVFKLTHSGQRPIIFQADCSNSVEKWVMALKEASVLSEVSETSEDSRPPEEESEEEGEGGEGESDLTSESDLNLSRSSTKS